MDEAFIPQHHILYIKRTSDGEIVWDRRKRIDRFLEWQFGVQVFGFLDVLAVASLEISLEWSSLSVFPKACFY